MLVKLGGDPAGFAARRLTSRAAAAADLILALTTSHRDAVLELAPHKLHRTFTLAEAARLASDYGAESVSELAELRSQLSVDQLADIADPIGQPPEAFATVGRQIADLLPPTLELCRRSTTELGP